jgi:hypothetical protein
MSIPFDRILVRHWVRSYAKQVNAYLESVPIVKKEMRMFYVKLKDCIQVHTLLSNKYNVYKEYVDTSKQPEHSETNFKNLLINWDLSKFNKIVMNYDGKDFFIADGVHRLAVLYILNGDSAALPLNLVNIMYSAPIVKEIGLALKETTKDSHYNGWSNSRKEYGYHSFNFYNVDFTGQRNPAKRLNEMRKFYDFRDKYVMDIGCNTGGMLFHLPECQKALGVDFDKTCIKACNLIKKKLDLFENYTFLERDIDIDGVKDIFEKERPDVVFLLSMGSWLKKWSDVYSAALDNSNAIFLETNNDDEGKPQLDFFREKKCQITLVIENSNDDCTGNLRRKTYLITS